MPQAPVQLYLVKVDYTVDVKQPSALIEYLLKSVVKESTKQAKRDQVVRVLERTLSTIGVGLTDNSQEGKIKVDCQTSTSDLSGEESYSAAEDDEAR